MTYPAGDALRRTAASDRAVVAWRNGQGTTQVVAETARWRVSIADLPVESRFSAIPGFDRIFIPLADEPIELSGPAPHDHSAAALHRVIHPMEPFEFPGEWAPHCRTARPARALNVMGERAGVELAVEIGDLQLPADQSSVRIYLDVGTESAIIVPAGIAAPADRAGTGAVISIREPR